MTANRVTPSTVSTSSVIAEVRVPDPDTILIPVPVPVPTVLSPATRRALWSLLVALQLTNAVLLALLTFLYATRSVPSSLLWTAVLYFLFADECDFIDENYLVVATGYALLSAAFATSVLHLVRLSLRSRRVRFGASDKLASRARRVQSRPNTSRTISSSLHIGHAASTSCVHRLRTWIGSTIFLVSVHGPFFDVRYIVERIIGVATQSIAAYSCSESVSNLPLNQTFGVVLFLTCISTSVLHRVFRERPMHRRLAYLVADLVLSFIWGSVVPAWMHFGIVYSHYASLDDTATSAREVGRVLVLSWPKFMLSTIPFISSLASSLGIQAVLCHWSTQIQSMPPARGSVAALSPPQDGDEPSRQADIKTVQVNIVTSVRTRAASVIHGTIAVYGCTVLVVSLAASDILGLIVKQPLYPCVYQLHPWFSTKEACVKRFINCTALGIEGRRADIEAALVLFDGPSLSDLHLQNCPALELPTTLHQFDTLTRLVIQYSWISEWSVQAGLTSETSTTLKTIKVIHTDTNVTLHGLVSVPIAKTIEYIRFYDVPNAETILRPIGNNWQHLRCLDCDACDLPDVPFAVDTMYQLLTISFIESRIATLRDNWITTWNLNLDGLWMDGNAALTELSDIVWRQSASSAMFSLQSTNVATIPDWVPTVARRDFIVYGYGSPLCEPSAIARRHVESARVRRLVRCDEN